MASASLCYCYSLIIITQLLLICVAQEKICPFKYVYQFGDSISDTGDLIRIGPAGAFAAARLPYGETFFHRPTGRWSDGLLIIDFFGRLDQTPYYTQASYTFMGADIILEKSTKSRGRSYIHTYIYIYGCSSASTNF